MRVKLTAIVIITFIFCNIALVEAQNITPFEYGESTEYNPAIPSPQSILGYQIGEQFTPYYKLEQYLQALAESSERLLLRKYGESNEGRPLYLLIFSAPQNLASLDDIRLRVKKLADPRLFNSDSEVNAIINNSPAVVWLSYNVHGNESCGTEAAIQVAYQLAAGNDEKTLALLNDLIIIIDPVLNPDGRERYVSFYRRTVAGEPNPDKNAAEHFEPWPGGRSNHYYFDLNRDWAWLTQVETRQRIAAYHEWMPQVHVDFHEMGYMSTYFFFPPRKPVNKNISQHVLKWNHIFGKANAEAFDKYGWQYYTNESFDLFYPGFGDSYPSLNNSVGMTYEQGGGGRAGLLIKRDDNTFLSLTDRSWHHFTASMATLGKTQEMRRERLKDFYSSWQESLQKGREGKVTSYIIPPQKNTSRVSDVIDLLMRHGIEVWRAQDAFTCKTINFDNLDVSRKKCEKDSYIIQTAQPSYRLLAALFEVNPALEDTFFFDLSAWCLPIASGIEAYWTEEKIGSRLQRVTDKPSATGRIINGKAQYAYLLPWDDDNAISALDKLLAMKIRVSVARKSFELDNRPFQRGTLVIPVLNQEVMKNNDSLYNFIQRLADESGLTFYATNTGFTEKGIDLGSNAVTYLKKPKIAVITESPTSSTSYGALWYLFEKVYEIDFSALTLNQLKRIDLHEYTTIIFPDEWGSGRGYKAMLDSVAIEKIRQWIRNGGIYIGIQGGAAFATADYSKLSSVALKKDRPKKKEMDAAQLAEQRREMHLTYEQKEKEWIKRRIPGTILRVSLDTTHPIGFGYDKTILATKVTDTIFDLSKNGNNVGIYTEKPKFAGFLSKKNEEKISDTAYIVHERQGSGQVILFTEDPVYRIFWRGTTKLLMNAIYFGQVL